MKLPAASGGGIKGFLEGEFEDDSLSPSLPLLISMLKKWFRSLLYFSRIILRKT
jgi:hypothetical protein